MLLCPDGVHPPLPLPGCAVVHCQPNPGKEDLGFASGELQPVIEKNLEKEGVPSKTFIQDFPCIKYVCIHTNSLLVVYTYTLIQFAVCLLYKNIIQT